MHARKPRAGKPGRRSPQRATEPEEVIGASDFKARCLEILDRVARERVEIVITKRGKPVARIGPAERKHPPLKGLWKGLGRTKGDIVRFNVSGDWEALG